MKVEGRSIGVREFITTEELIDRIAQALQRRLATSLLYKNLARDKSPTGK
jgi:hypothetical protein